MAVCFEIYFFYIIFRFLYWRIKNYVPKPKVKFEERQKPNYTINESWTENLVETSPNKKIVIEDLQDLEVVQEVTDDEASAALLTPSVLGLKSLKKIE